ncbi:hypothetical protein E3E36_08945 [Thermococcus sp. M36]|uniref:hypothetical protein n=1 Tax=Thermococcus sp. M36 TaxID=1638261 RepID=UPI00143917F1|nr:hypothetical protein [Thermococcus sp. M36]NJE06266.1 hypothetical protein [Thermococcus sp. M36]
MGVSIRVSLPLIFPGLLMVSTFQIMVEVSGREEGIAAGALFSTVILPFLFAGYYLAKNRKEDIKWVSDVLPIFGFYPFAYAVRSPLSWLLAGLIILIPLLSMRHIEMGDKQINAVVFALSMLECLGIPNKSLIVIGLILLSLAFYTFRKRLELQYIVSYVILWTFVNQVYKVDYLVLSMGFLFGFAVFVMIHYTTKRTLALLKKGYDDDSGDRNSY